MALVNMFLLLPETEPSSQWMLTTDRFHENESFITMVRELEEKFETIKFETYQGFYDRDNIDNFLEFFDIFENYYPSKPRRIIRELLSGNACDDWRETVTQSDPAIYRIFRNPVNVFNTFCEIARRKSVASDQKFALLNHYACVFQNNIDVEIDSNLTISIFNIRTNAELSTWFSNNRIPMRVFNLNPKHGENRAEIIYVNGEIVSPLRCSRERAQLLLHTAVGECLSELFNYDSNHNEIIIFKYEGPAHLNVYHGYHVPLESRDVPATVVNLLRNIGVLPS